MEKKDKTLITILVILLIAIIVGVCLYCKTEPTNTKSEENTSNTTIQENNKEDEISNTIEENNVEKENIVEENVVEENKVEEKETTPEIIGKEEEESKKENTGKTNEEKAIEVAKKEWGTEEGVSFDIQNREGNIYTVAVRSTSNTQVYAWYRVNVESEKIEE